MNPKTPESCTNLEEIRNEINRIDYEIVHLIAERENYVKAASAFKKSATAVRDEKRVAEVIQSKKKLAEQVGISPEIIGKIYEILIHYFVEKEMTEWTKKQ